MRVLGLVAKPLVLSALALSPFAFFGCSSGDPEATEPVAKTLEPVLWTATSNNMASMRADHAAAALGDANGRVIVCGGRSSGSAFIPGCDIYNPTTNAWSTGSAMPQMRAFHTLTALGPSSLLLAGGSDGVDAVGAPLPGTGAAWQAAETGFTARFQHRASLLSNGTVIVSGGKDLSANVPGAQRRMGTSWSAAGTQDRANHAAVVLSSGTQVFVTGGDSGATTLNTAATYTASSNSWAAATAMTGAPSARRYHTATLLPDGTVLVVGGEDAGPPLTIHSQAIRYNPTTNMWTNAGTTVARSEHAAALVGGYVIVAGGRTTGGSTTGSVQAYNPDTNTWTTLESFVTPRTRFTLTALPSNRLLAAGGVNGGAYLSTAEVFAARAIGAACTAPTQIECLSGNCADAVCCNTTCTGQCQACNESGLVGTCSPVSGTPRGSRGNCANGYLCVSGSCATSCTSDAQCQSTYYCTTSGTPGVCALKKVQGDPCAGANQCGAGLSCVDGYCCNDTCTGQCERCNAPGNLGSCIPTQGAPTAPRAACGGAGVGTVCERTCDGIDTDACTYPSGNECRMASCSNGTATLAATCLSGGCELVTQGCGAYVCGATACRTTCSSNTHCSTGNFCDGSVCAPLRMRGQDCTTGTQCQSGNCVNAVCCDSPSCAAGSSCALTNHRGECRKTIGTGCMNDTECGSDQCADSVCCNADCAGQCERCDASGQVGTCTATFGPPAGTRPACGGTGAGTVCGESCNGVTRNACVPAPNTTTCRLASCAQGTAILVQSCNGAGLCPDSTVPCGAYTCDAAGVACRTSCTVRADCAAAHLCDTSGPTGVCNPIPGLGSDCTNGSTCSTTYCVNGVCCGSETCPTGSSCALQGFRGTCMKDLGTRCTGNAECGSGHCVDDRCCNSDCDGQCEACDVGGSLGTCIPVPVDEQPHEPRAQCQVGPVINPCGLRCDGVSVDVCSYPGQGSACGTLSCRDGEETRTGTCDGSGTCSGSTRMCGAYACNSAGTACNRSCSTADDCAAGYFCLANECVPTLGDGRDCEDNAACDSGYCVDGVCCTIDSCPEGATCAYPGHRGECTSDDGTECEESADCGSEYCVDGFCCNDACEGQCEACNVAGREGSCSPVSREPVGDRPACDQGDGLCGVRACSGDESTDECVGYANGTSTVCAPAACDGSDFTPAAVCNGAGACRTPDVTSCLPYRCEATGCLLECDDNSACADGYHCADGECAASTATCSPDRRTSIPVEGTPVACEPYRCTTDGTCATSCQTSSDCDSGYACDTSTSPGQCKAVKAAGADEEGGCGCSVPGRSTSHSASLWLLALAAGASVARRRRQRWWQQQSQRPWP